MPRRIEGRLDSKGKRYALIASRYNDAIVSRLLQGALDCLERHGVLEDDITIHRTPGAFEIPQLARRLAASKMYDAVICLGALVRGETSHFEFIASSVTRGISQAAEETGVPVTFGVLTTNTMEQARERSGGSRGNKGWEAAAAAIEMAGLLAAMCPELS